MNIIEIARNKPETKVLLSMMKLADTETYNHSLAVAGITTAILENTDYSKEEQIEIITGALLHDIGKIFIPFNLTQLPRSLSSQEFQIVKIHASISYEIVKDTFSKMVQDICLYHHERPNGTGYLSGVTLKDIPKEALLVQVADIYDALTSNRSYKKGYKSEEAIEIMRDEAFQFKLDDQYLFLLEQAIQKKK